MGIQIPDISGLKHRLAECGGRNFIIHVSQTSVNLFLSTILTVLGMSIGTEMCNRKLGPLAAIYGLPENLQ